MDVIESTEIEFKYLQRKWYDAIIKAIINTFKLDTEQSQRLALKHIDDKISEIENKKKLMLDGDYAIERLTQAKIDMYKPIIVPSQIDKGVNKAEQTENISSMAAAANGGKNTVTARNCSVSMEESRQMNASIAYYSDSAGQDTHLRQLQYFGKLKDKDGNWYIPDRETKDRLNKHIETIERFIARAPKWNGGPTYRGMAVSDKLAEDWRALKIKDICMLGVSSWSRDENTAMHYAELNCDKNNPRKVVFVCEGKQYGTNIEYNSNKEIEREVLCSNNARYNVVDFEIKDDVTWFYVKQIAKH